MSKSNPIYEFLFGSTPKPSVRRPRRTNMNQHPINRHIVIKHKGHLKRYRINRYGEVIEAE